MTGCLVGLDLGTTTFKASVVGLDGRCHGTERVPTPWTASVGRSVMSPEVLAAVVRDLVATVVDRHADEPVLAVGVTGLAETGFAETPAGLQDAVAWTSSPAGAARPPEEHWQRTGLVDPTRATISTLRARREAGEVVTGWTGLTERAVMALGGRRVAETTLAARTGLVDVATRDWDQTLCAWAGVAGDALAPIVPGGTPLGEVAIGAAAVDGAVLSVAGHDHPVAAVGADAWGPGHIFDSLGTGEAVVAYLDDLTDQDRERLHAAGFAVGPGLGGRGWSALRGLGTGRRLDRVLRLLAAAGHPREDVTGVLPQSVRPVPQAPVADLVAAVVDDGLDPGPAAVETFDAHVADLAAAHGVWWFAVDRGAERVRQAVEVINSLDGPVRRLTCAGGWLADPGVREVRRRRLGHVHHPDVPQAGTRGAALLAALALPAGKRPDLVVGLLEEGVS